MSSVRSLNRTFDVDLAIKYAKKSFVIIRFGDAEHQDCKDTDKWINDDAAAIEFAEIYNVNMSNVPELVARYSLSGPNSIIFFHEGRAVCCLPTAEIKKKRQNGKFSDFAKQIKDKCTNIPLERSQTNAKKETGKTKRASPQVGFTVVPGTQQTQRNENFAASANNIKIRGTNIPPERSQINVKQEPGQTKRPLPAARRTASPGMLRRLTTRIGSALERRARKMRPEKRKNNGGHD